MSAVLQVGKHHVMCWVRMLGMCHVLFIKGVAVLSMRSGLPQQAHVLDNAMGFTAGEQESELGSTVLAA
jgi:hypothetical protein